MSLTQLFAGKRLLDVVAPIAIWLVIGVMLGPSIGGLIEWSIAIVVSAGVIWLATKWLRGGDLDRDGGWGRLLGVLLIAFACTWFTKWLQVAVQADFRAGLAANFWFAWFRKLDDISFWTMIIGLIVCFFAVLYLRGAGIRLSWSRTDRVWLGLWLAFGAIAVAAYLYAVGVHNPDNRGTFFWRNSSSHQPEITKLLQVTEGTAVVLFIVVAHLVHVAYLKGLWSYFRLGRSAAARPPRGRFVRYGLVPTMYAVLIAVASATFVGNKLGLFDSTVVQVKEDGTRASNVAPGHLSRMWKENGYPGEFGNKPHYGYKNVLILSALVWWPFAGPLLIWGAGLWLTTRSKRA